MGRPTMTRELDVQVAEKVFGCRVSQEYVIGDDFGTCTKDAPYCGCENEVHQHPGDLTVVGPVLAFYSSTWEGAGLVVEKLAEKGFDVIIYYCLRDWGVDVAVNIQHANDASGNIILTEYASSFPEAVCKAAVKALDT